MSKVIYIIQRPDSEVHLTVPEDADRKEVADIIGALHEGYQSFLLLPESFKLSWIPKGSRVQDIMRDNLKYVREVLELHQERLEFSRALDKLEARANSLELELKFRRSGH